MKAVFAIADGMGDRPIKNLDDKTPLEAANKSSLDRIAQNGISGTLDPISPGVPPGSDTSTLALLGYNAPEVYSGRGALEALGSGVDVLGDEVAFRCNFATIGRNRKILDRRAGRIVNEDASKLSLSLQRVKLSRALNASFLFKSTVQHRAVLIVRGPKLSAAISDSDPARTGVEPLRVKPLNKSLAAERTAKIVNTLLFEFHRVLESDPVNKDRLKRGLPPGNVILCRGAGTVPKIEPFSQVYPGIRGACVGATPLTKGVCRAAGMELITVPGATGTPQTDYMAKARATVQTLKKYDLVVLHVKATDVASHDKNAELKVQVIEKIDEMLGYVYDHTDQESTYLTFTTDHTTSVITGNHEGDPVPVVITGPYIRKDGTKEFGERTCARGGLGRLRGKDIMPILMNFLGKTKQFGF